jgi:hypothetical protein
VDGFDLFRTRRPGFIPRTPAAALKAVGAGNLPAEYFIYASTSVKPLDEEPFDLEEIERLLARPDMSLATNILLKGVLSKLIGSREQEVALFGAEGITALEGRLLASIEELKASIPPQGGRRLRCRLARELYTLAELNAGAVSVRSFYLRNACVYLRPAFRRKRISRSEIVLATDILIALGRYDSAARLLRRVHAGDDPGLLLLSARVAYRRGDYVRVSECCRRIGADADCLDVNERRAVAFWAGGNA